MDSKNVIKAAQDELAKVVELSILYDFYGELLGERRKRIFEDSVLNDFSLAEVAQEIGISRQGVHDVVKRCTAELYEYEDKLGLVEKFKVTKQKADQIREITKTLYEERKDERFMQILTLTDEITNHM